MLLAGLIALALLGLGEAALAAFPVPVTIVGHGSELQVTVDGQTHLINSTVGPGWRGIALDQPTPFDREYQIDGSDTTSTLDRQPAVLVDLLQSPLYAVDAWLRDEPSFSRWERVRVTDLATGAAVDRSDPLPNDFRVDAVLRRPEAAAHIWLVGPTPNVQEGLELDRDRRNARWIVQSNGARTPLPRWFFPEQAAPFAAELLHFLGRTVAAAFVLAAAAWLLGLAFGLLEVERRSRPLLERAAGSRVLRDVVLAAWLLAAGAVTVKLYHQLPHILDAVSYSFQAGVFSSGKLGLATPPLADAFKGPFQIVTRGHLLSQYPPGAPAVYALGRVVGLEWIVGALCCMLLIGATAAVARRLYGAATGLAVLLLGALSPFVLFQSGSYLSHPVAGGLLAAALWAFVTADGTRRERWYVLAGALLGCGFVSREAASLLFAIPLGARLIGRRNVRGIAAMMFGGVPLLLVYLFYNQQATGSAVLLPRQLFDPSDRFGFGDGIGFHTRHTLAAGLANTDELLTSLQLELLGWPPLFALGLLCVPFLFGRARSWDYLWLLGVASFAVAYVGYFYHGVALGPRYYFEAVPYMLLLAGRGVQVLAQVARSRLAAGVVVGLLVWYALGFYLPLELQRRTDLSGQPSGHRTNLTFVQSTLFGPKVTVPQTPALVTTEDWWLYNTALAPLNCPQLPDCEVLFGLATTPADAARLRLQFPNRAAFRAIDNQGQVTLVPAS